MTEIIRVNLTQSVADANEFVAIDTGLGVADQKTIWSVVGFDVEWENCNEFVAGDNKLLVLKAGLTMKRDKLGFLNPELIQLARWTGLQAGAPNGGNIVMIDSVQRIELLAPYKVANSTVYFGVHSFLTGLKNSLNLRLYYDIEKVSELDFLKIQSGYCVC